MTILVTVIGQLIIQSSVYKTLKLHLFALHKNMIAWFIFGFSFLSGNEFEQQMLISSLWNMFTFLPARTHEETLHLFIFQWTKTRFSYHAPPPLPWQGTQELSLKTSDIFSSHTRIFLTIYDLQIQDDVEVRLFAQFKCPLVKKW